MPDQPSRASPGLVFGPDPARVERVGTGGTRILNVAHRGASAEAPENTLSAFERAIEVGADAIEVDVRVTADGHAVVLHDATLDRTTSGSGRVRRSALRDVLELDAGGGARVPTVADVLELARGRAGVFLEVKDVGAVSPVLEAVSAADMEHGVAIMAFDRRALRAAETAPAIAGVQLTRNRADTAVSLHRDRGTALGARHQVIDGRLVERCHERGRALLAWTADEDADLRRLLDLGVDAIVTNYPSRLAALLAGGDVPAPPDPPGDGAAP